MLFFVGFTLNPDHQQCPAVVHLQKVLKQLAALRTNPDNLTAERLKRRDEYEDKAESKTSIWIEKLWELQIAS